MAGELNIKDESFANELLSLPLPVAFIDFEAFIPTIPGIVPGVNPTMTIPCQFSCHTIYEHGLDCIDTMTHSEYLWIGDRGWNPIYSFVQSLYAATEDAATIVIYTVYERTCMNDCILMAETDIARWRENAKLDGWYAYADDGVRYPLASFYWELCDWLNDGCSEPFPIVSENGQEMDAADIIDVIRDWQVADPVPYDTLVVDMYGNKVPLSEVADQIKGMCESMKARFYDEAYGPDSKDGGVRRWLQSPEFHNSNSIKYVLPVAMKEYSGSADLLVSQGLPANGYEGLRAMGKIAKGDECTTHYLACLDRPPRAGVPFDAPGHAPFDPDIIDQCLTYCKLDTLAMVIIYLAVLEGTQRWAEEAYGTPAEFIRIEDEEQFHFLVMDGDNQVFYKGCDENFSHPYDYDIPVEIISEAELMNMPIREQYASICPRCRRLRNLEA